MIISVASGKGGTGKTLVATNVALSLAKEDRVQLLDCDVEEPDAHIFLKPIFNQRKPVFIPIPQVDEGRCTYCGKCAEVCAYHAIAVLKKQVLVFSELCHGCGACSYLCPEDAITEVGREIGIVEIEDSKGIEFIHGKLNVGEALAPPVVREVKKHIKQGRTTIIDVAPGTSCPVVEAVKGSDFCILVTEPTPFGLNDLTLAVEMVKELGVPCGVVLNRTGVGDKKVEDYCLGEGIPILLQIPLDIEIARLYSQGIPLVEDAPHWQETFLQLFHDIEQVVQNIGRGHNMSKGEMFGEEIVRERIAQEEMVKERTDEKGNKWRKVYFGGGAHFTNWLEQCKELGEVEVEEINSTGFKCYEEGSEKLFRIWMKVSEEER